MSDLALGRCAELRARIQQITDGEYATAKRDVDALRAELGQPPLPSLQTTLEEKSQQYVRLALTVAHRFAKSWYANGPSPAIGD